MLLLRILQMNKAVFLDRDGTINVDKNYLYRKEDFELLPHTIEALRLLQNAGFLLVVITNQSGIARGYYTEEQFMKLNQWMIETFRTKGITIDAVYYCPHHPQAKIEQYRRNCNCRKPKTKLFEDAVRDLNIDLAKSFAIGDRLRDCSICQRSNCRGFVIGNTESLDIIQKIKSGDIINVSYQPTLLETAQTIVNEMIYE